MVQKHYKRGSSWGPPVSPVESDTDDSEPSMNVIGYYVVPLRRPQQLLT